MIGEFRRKPLFYIAILFSFGILIQTHFFPQKVSDNDISLVAQASSGAVSLKGKIVSEVDERKTFYGDKNATFVLCSAGGLVKCYLTNPKEQLSYGDEISIKGEFAFPKGVRNPGGFDKCAYLERQGIRMMFYGDKKSDPEILSRGHGNPVRGKAIRIKQFISKSIAEEFSPRDAAFLQALFLGEKSGLDEEFKELFIKTGTMHILAVSGFNIGFLIVTILFLIKPFSVPKNTRYWIMIVIVWVYCVLVGWQAPLVRASFMATVFIAGQLLGRKTNILNTLGFAAIALLLVNSKQIFDIGFQLSFLAVYAIAEFLPVFVSSPKLLPNEQLTFWEKCRIYTEELFWVSFVCILVTLPITIQNFYIVTPLSLLANLIVVSISFMIFFSGLCFFLTFWWLGKFLPVIPFIIKLAIEFFTVSLRFIENIPGAYFISGKLDTLLLVLLIAGIFYLLKTRQIENRLIRASALLLLVANILLAQSTLRYFHREFKMTVLDVGQGDSIYFEFPNGGNLLIDAGKSGDGDRGRWVIKPFLWSKGVSSIDAVATTHPQEDHIGGMAAVFDEFKIKHVIDAGTNYGTKTFERLKEKIMKEKAAHFVVHEGQQVEGFPGIEVSVLNPGKSEAPDKNVNNESVVLKIIYKGTSFLLTGDIEKKAMRNILDSRDDLKCDVLKVPHHGAKLDATGEEFVKAVSPKVSVISVGEKNKYRHPFPETLSILESVSGNQIFRTDKDSAVEIVSDGRTVSVLTPANN